MNPFRYGQVVRGEDFCPRPKLIQELTAFIESGQNVALMGERRTGKTSLICEAVRCLKKRRMLYVDLLEIKTSDDLCKRLLKAVLALQRQTGFLEKMLRSLSHLRPSITLDPLTGQPSISLDASVRMTPESIDSLLDMIASLHRRQPLAVVFDEFQDVLNLEDSRETLASLRSKIQFQNKIPYLFAGSIRNQMSMIFADPESPFFKSAASLSIGPIETGLFAEFLKRRFESGKRTVEESAMSRVFEWAEDIPGDVQQLCAVLWEITSYRDPITEDLLPAALERIFARESKAYEAVLVQVTGQQLRCLVGLARHRDTPPLSQDFLRAVGIPAAASVQRALNRLEKLKVVYRHEGRYKFVNPFFKSWLIYKDF
jgi:uncharacterized protein